jgi:uncharacterized protein DUF3850
MTVHRLTAWPEYFDAVASGARTFEVRRDDLGFAVGDTLILTRFPFIPGDGELEARITYVQPYIGSGVMASHGGFGVMPGYAVLGLQLTGQRAAGQGQPS